MSHDPKHPARPVKCPKCGKVKVTKYATFKHCRRIHATDKNALDGTPERPKRRAPGTVEQKAGSAFHQLEVTW